MLCLLRWRKACSFWATQLMSGKVWVVPPRLLEPHTVSEGLLFLLLCTLRDGMRYQKHISHFTEAVRFGWLYKSRCIWMQARAAPD